jgi:hypothetical protein
VHTRHVPDRAEQLPQRARAVGLVGVEPQRLAARHIGDGPDRGGVGLRVAATLVNTARGGLIDEDALVAVLRARPDLFAVLDVTDPEPPVPGSPLFTLPNVVVTPHLAGSLGAERRRQGRMMAEELARYCAGEPLEHEVTESGLERSA